MIQIKTPFDMKKFDDFCHIKCFNKGGDLVIRWANHMSGFFGHPVYLVGSQLYKTEPRDCDIVCIIPNDEFVLRYINQSTVIGHTDDEKADQWTLRYQCGMYNESNWLWCDDMSHKSLQGMNQTLQLIDFKVYPQGYIDRYQKTYREKPILRIDERT